MRKPRLYTQHKYKKDPDVRIRGGSLFRTPYKHFDIPAEDRDLRITENLPVIYKCWCILLVVLVFCWATTKIVNAVW